MNEPAKNILGVSLAVGVLITVVVGGGIGGCSAYNSVRVWNADTAGRAQLAEAQSNRQIKTLEAKAAKESAQYLADADITRATGQARANKILQNSLGGPEGYLQFLKIEAMKETKANMIYVPTEAQLPVTEASRFGPMPSGGE
ncbi:hypothetical protein [Sphingomonas sp. SRS2]|uniref:hypothetical protein n=1 Tax=Sphingomonas sp. SRS2 TaxID=133190 RepID=UPI0006184CC1|nr:hypothetical protein [Sphingomonas sp. SRS2]KKC27321.1 hypothetical protein WP12_04020 [Sphingomonas sp. SRS2]